MSRLPDHPSPKASCIVSVQRSSKKKPPVVAPPPLPSAILLARPMQVISHDTSLTYVPPLTVIVAKTS